MSLYSYEIVDAVVKEGSFLKAAERLHLSPSAVSHSVARLEERFQTKLFNRNRSRIELTTAGEHLMPYIRNILREENILSQEADHLHGEARGTVRLGTLGSVCRTWLPDILGSFMELYPEINVIVSQGSIDRLLGWARLKSVDLAFLPETLVSDEKRTRLHSDRLICVAPPDFVPSNGSTVSAGDLRKNDLINYYGVNNSDAEEFLANDPAAFRSVFHVDDVYTMISMIECGFGIGITTRLTAVGAKQNIRIFDLEPAAYRIISLVETDPDFQTRAVQIFRDHIFARLTANGEAELL